MGSRKRKLRRRGLRTSRRKRKGRPKKRDWSRKSCRIGIQDEKISTVRIIKNFPNPLLLGPVSPIISLVISSPSSSFSTLSPPFLSSRILIPKELPLLNLSQPYV